MSYLLFLVVLLATVLLAVTNVDTVSNALKWAFDNPLIFSFLIIILRVVLPGDADHACGQRDQSGRLLPCRAKSPEFAREFAYEGRLCPEVQRRQALRGSKNEVFYWVSKWNRLISVRVCWVREAARNDIRYLTPIFKSSVLPVLQKYWASIAPHSPLSDLLSILTIDSGITYAIASFVAGSFKVLGKILGIEHLLFGVGCVFYILWLFVMPLSQHPDTPLLKASTILEANAYIALGVSNTPDRVESSPSTIAKQAKSIVLPSPDAPRSPQTRPTMRSTAQSPEIVRSTPPHIPTPKPATNDDSRKDSIPKTPASSSPIKSTIEKKQKSTTCLSKMSFNTATVLAPRLLRPKYKSVNKQVAEERKVDVSLAITASLAIALPSKVNLHQVTGSAEDVAEQAIGMVVPKKKADVVPAVEETTAYVPEAVADMTPNSNQQPVLDSTVSQALPTAAVGDDTCSPIIPIHTCHDDHTPALQLEPMDCYQKAEHPIPMDIGLASPTTQNDPTSMEIIATTPNPCDSIEDSTLPRTPSEDDDNRPRNKSILKSPTRMESGRVERVYAPAPRFQIGDDHLKSWMVRAELKKKKHQVKKTKQKRRQMRVLSIAAPVSSALSTQPNVFDLTRSQAVEVPTLFIDAPMDYSPLLVATPMDCSPLLAAFEWLPSSAMEVCQESPVVSFAPEFSPIIECPVVLEDLPMMDAELASPLYSPTVQSPELPMMGFDIQPVAVASIKRNAQVDIGPTQQRRAQDVPAPHTPTSIPAEPVDAAPSVGTYKPLPRSAVLRTPVKPQPSPQAASFPQRLGKTTTILPDTPAPNYVTVERKQTPESSPLPVPSPQRLGRTTTILPGSPAPSYTTIERKPLSQKLTVPTPQPVLSSQRLGKTTAILPGTPAPNCAEQKQPPAQTPQPSPQPVSPLQKLEKTTTILPGSPAPTYMTIERKQSLQRAPRPSPLSKCIKPELVESDQIPIAPSYCRPLGRAQVSEPATPKKNIKFTMDAQGKVPVPEAGLAKDVMVYKWNLDLGMPGVKLRAPKELWKTE